MDEAEAEAEAEAEEEEDEEDEEEAEEASSSDEGEDQLLDKPRVRSRLSCPLMFTLCRWMDRQWSDIYGRELLILPWIIRAQINSWISF